MSDSAPCLTLFDELLEIAEAGRDATPPELTRIPVDVYTSQARFESERRLMTRVPLAIAHESQLADEGDALVSDWLGTPFITVRDREGAIRSFLNVCRHRGMRLVQDTGQVKLRGFTCPYHHWSYGLDGRLRSVPLQRSFDGLEKSGLGLVQLPTEVRHGLVWVQLTPGQDMQLDQFLGGLGPDFDYFDVPTHVYHRQHARRIACNWKLIQDAFLDGYHVTRLHKDTVGGFFPDALAATEIDGVHVRSAVARNEVHDASGRPPSHWTMRQHATYSYTLFPNSIVIMHPDYTSHIALYPLSPGESLFVHNQLLPERPANEKARAHYDTSFELIDGGVFQAEDIFVSEGAQKGMATGANTHLLAGGHERGLRYFHSILDRELDALA